MLPVFSMCVSSLVAGGVSYAPHSQSSVVLYATITDINTLLAFVAAPTAQNTPLMREYLMSSLVFDHGMTRRKKARFVDCGYQIPTTTIR